MLLAVGLAAVSSGQAGGRSSLVIDPSQSWTAWWAAAGDYSITSYYRDSKGSTRKVAVVRFAVT